MRIYFNPRSPHGERRRPYGSDRWCGAISIHAPRTGSDRSKNNRNYTSCISIHAPRTGSDLDERFNNKLFIKFQSTLPARGATPSSGTPASPWRFQSTLPARGATFGSAPKFSRMRISIHAPRTGSDASRKKYIPWALISIHAPRTGSDQLGDNRLAGCVEFQSTLPARGATWGFSQVFCVLSISIHAPRTGSDFQGAGLLGLQGCISIHAPRTGSDKTVVTESGNRLISIHAPRTGSDLSQGSLSTNFDISIHAPRTGSDRFDSHSSIRRFKFQSTLPARGATAAAAACLSWTLYFNPRSPHGERLRKVTILSIRIIGFAQKVYHKTVLLRISLAENAVILPKRPRNPVRTSLQKAGGLRFARAIRAARPYSISSPSGA